MSTKPTTKFRSLHDIARDYTPYDKFPAFWEGVTDWHDRLYVSRYDDGVEAQAWDRGAEAAMRYRRQWELG